MIDATTAEPVDLARPLRERRFVDSLYESRPDTSAEEEHVDVFAGTTTGPFSSRQRVSPPVAQVRSVDEQEELALLEVREDLLEKKYSGGLTVDEEKRLAMVRWSLDRIESQRSETRLSELRAGLDSKRAVAGHYRDLLAQAREAIAANIEANAKRSRPTLKR